MSELEYRPSPKGARVKVATPVNRVRPATTGVVYEYEFDGEAWFDTDDGDCGFGIVEKYWLHALWHARTDIHALVAEVERLREALRVEREACDEWRGAAPKDVQLTDGITSPQWMPCHHGLAVCAVKHDARRAKESPYGLSVVVDNSVPPCVVELRQGGKVVGRITDIGDDRRAKEPT